VPREAALLKAVRQTVPTAKSVCMPVSGNCRFHAYISIAKRTPGQAKNAICAAFASDMLLKHVIVVDEDIDVYDEEQVLWIDATKPLTGFAPELRVPENVMQRIRLEDFLPELVE